VCDKSIFAGRQELKKTILSAVMLAMILTVAAPAVAQVGQGFDQDSSSGVVDQSLTVTGEGSVANQCSALLAAAQTGNSQGSSGSIRSNSGIGQSEQEDIGSSLAVSPEVAEVCEQKINQAAAASSPKQTPKAAPETTPAPAPKLADKAEDPQAKATATQAKAKSKVEEKKTKTEETKAEAKELPKTGGGATLFVLGAGVLVVGVGLLARGLVR
jgi:uncharacterized surface anchored protein